MGIVAVYSFLIAFVLPTPSEVVLAAPLDLGFGPSTELGIVTLVGGVVKAAGSEIALRVEKEIRAAAPTGRFSKRRGVDVGAWSERQAVRLAERYGYVGLAIALTIPGHALHLRLQRPR